MTRNSHPPMPSPSKLAAGIFTKQFAEALGEILWRPKSSGRHHVEPWLNALLAQALRLSGGNAAKTRQKYVDLLRQEDPLHPRHMSQVAPSDHRHSLYAYRVWPDKLQALITFDRLVRPLNLPEAVRNGLWQPAALYRPRFSVVEIIQAGESQGEMPKNPGWYLHFAETPDVLFVSSLSDPSILVQHRLAKERERASMTRQHLERICQIFADPAHYINARLAPALWANPQAAAEDLPTFGLCTASMLACRPGEGDVEASLAYVRTRVAEEQNALRQYIASVRFDFLDELGDRLGGQAAKHWANPSGTTR